MQDAYVAMQVSGYDPQKLKYKTPHKHSYSPRAYPIKE